VPAGRIGAAPGIGAGLANFLVTPPRRLVGVHARYNSGRGKCDCRHHNENMLRIALFPYPARITKTRTPMLSRSI
jgi:hypothetical protein